MLQQFLDVNEKQCDDDNEASLYQNSYQLEPRDIFNIDRIDKITNATIIASLECLCDNTTEQAKTCNKITTNILTQIQKLQFGRYKIIVIMTIIENANQSFDFSIGHLWDVKRDNYTTFTIETQMYHVLCCVFGIYYE